jgi:chemotaxis protein MotB
MIKKLLPTLCVILAAGCGVSKDEFAAQQRDAQQNKQKYEEESAKRAALEKQIADLQQQTATLQQQLGELSVTSKKLAEEKGALEAKSAQYQQLASSLQSQIATGQVELSELRGKMTVKLKDRILFSSASASLNKQGKAALDAVAAAFKDLKDKNVIVAGYTDDVPIGSKSGFADNWALSTARAVNVVRYLQEKGVSPAMLGAEGFSEYRPVLPNDSAANRSQNRRIEIALTAADYVAPVVDTPK